LPKTKRRKRAIPAPIALTHDELRSVLLKARETDYPVYLLMLIQYHHAGRNSEMIHLQAKNFADGFITYTRGKGSEPCRQRLVHSKDDLLNETKVVPEFVGKMQPKQRLYPRTRWTYWRHLVKIALAAGIPRFKAKTTVLKHSIVSHVVKKYGVPAGQRRAGHVNGANTLIYARLAESEVDELVSQGLAG
jgi:integrase